MMKFGVWLLNKSKMVSLALMPDLESVKTPIQRLLDSVGQGDNSEADGGFCKEETVVSVQLTELPLALFSFLILLYVYF